MLDLIEFKCIKSVRLHVDRGAVAEFQNLRISVRFWRLNGTEVPMERVTGTDINALEKQIGTSMEMIDVHHGRVQLCKNAHAIAVGRQVVLCDRGGRCGFFSITGSVLLRTMIFTKPTITKLKRCGND